MEFPGWSKLFDHPEVFASDVLSESLGLKKGVHWLTHWSRAMHIRVAVHPKGLDPFQAAKAWCMRKRLNQPWKQIRAVVRTPDGSRPGRHAMEDAVRRIDEQQHTASFRSTGVARLAYSNCGRRPMLTDRQKSAVVSFVKRWRNKRFCTAAYIISELRLPCSKRTVHRVLNEAGYHWRPVAKKCRLSDGQLAARKVFVDAHIDKPASWWRQHFGLVLDGVTLTKAPRPLDKREKHAAQAIKHMWVKDGEALDNSLHTYNRYGVQLGEKVPLWGGFTGDGLFSFKLWTDKPKLSKEIWAQHIGTSVKRAASGRLVWHDNEMFLKQPDVYATHGLSMKCFPPNSGDLNPIETVWAWLRKELAQREMADMDEGRTLTTQQFRQRASQILQSFEMRKPGERQSRLEKLVAGMPKRMAQCKANNYGKCSK